MIYGHTIHISPPNSLNAVIFIPNAQSVPWTSYLAYLSSYLIAPSLERDQNITRNN